VLENGLISGSPKSILYNANGNIALETAISGTTASTKIKNTNGDTVMEYGLISGKAKLQLTDCNGDIRTILGDLS